MFVDDAYQSFANKNSLEFIKVKKFCGWLKKNFKFNFNSFRSRSLVGIYQKITLNKLVNKYLLKIYKDTEIRHKQKI